MQLPDTHAPRFDSLSDPSTRTRVLVVSVTRLLREGLAELLAREPLAPVVRVAASCNDALAIVRLGAPTIVMLDAGTPDAPMIARRLTPEASVRGIIAFAVSNDVASQVALAECGVRGYVSHDASMEELFAATRAALRGELHCTPTLAAALARRLAAVRTGRLDRVTALSHRERDIVRLVDDGLSNKEIALRLHIELATVKNHVHHILRKLGVQRRGEAAAVLRHWKATAGA